MHDLFVVLIVAVIAIGKWAAARGGDTDDSVPGPTGRPGADSEEERMRKVMEALGVPRGGIPPRRVTPRAAAAGRPLAPVRPPATPDIAPPIRRKERNRPAPALPAPAPRETRRAEPVPEPVRAIPAPAPAAAFVKMETPVAEPEPGGAPWDIRELLRNPASLRAAVVLREVLGPPRGLNRF